MQRSYFAVLDIGGVAPLKIGLVLVPGCKRAWQCVSHTGKVFTLQKLTFTFFVESLPQGAVCTNDSKTLTNTQVTHSYVGDHGSLMACFRMVGGEGAPPLRLLRIQRREKRTAWKNCKAKGAAARTFVVHGTHTQTRFVSSKNICFFIGIPIQESNPKVRCSLNRKKNGVDCLFPSVFSSCNEGAEKSPR